MGRRVGLLVALVLAVSPLLVASPSGASNPAMTRQQSAQEFKRVACRFYAADGPFVWSAYRGSDSVSRQQFNNRFRPITRQARTAEAAYNRVLGSISYHPFHPSVRETMRRLLNVSDRQRDDLFSLGYLSNRSQGWNEFNDWRNRNPRWSNLANRIQRELDIDRIRC